LTTCVVGLASSVKVIVAARAPSCDGVKVTATVQFAPAATVAPLTQVVPAPAMMLNSLAFAPTSATALAAARWSVSVPPLVRVTSSWRS